MTRALVLLLALLARPGLSAPRTLVHLSHGGPRRPGPAVLLVPGFGYGREIYAFHGEGLAHRLAARGWDAWIAEPPSDASFSDWIQRELPSAVAAVKGSHAGPVVLVVQGHAGALALAAAGRELAGMLAGIVAFNTPVEWELPNRVLGAVLERGGDLGTLAGRDGRAEFHLLYAHGAHLRHEVRAHFAAEGLRDLARPLAREWLDALRRGEPSLPGPTFRERVAALEVPVLLVLALRDNVAHPELSAPLREWAPRSKVTVRALDRFQGCAEDYTHLSVLLGEHARTDVFRHVFAWLEALP